MLRLSFDLTLLCYCFVLAGKRRTFVLFLAGQRFLPENPPEKSGKKEILFISLLSLGSLSRAMGGHDRIAVGDAPSPSFHLPNAAFVVKSRSGSLDRKRMTVSPRTIVTLRENLRMRCLGLRCYRCPCFSSWSSSMLKICSDFFIFVFVSLLILKNGPLDVRFGD